MNADETTKAVVVFVAIATPGNGMVEDRATLGYVRMPPKLIELLVELDEFAKPLDVPYEPETPEDEREVWPPWDVYEPLEAAVLAEIERLQHWAPLEAVQRAEQRRQALSA